MHFDLLYIYIYINIYILYIYIYIYIYYNIMQVCQAKATDSTRQWSLGVANATVWTLVNKSPIRLQITYSNGDGERGKLRQTF